MQVIGITGLIRTGKDAVADYLVEKHGFEKFVLSDIIVEEAKKRQIEPNKKNIAFLADELRKEKGFGTVAQKLAEKIKQKNPEKVVVVGFRSVEEIPFIKNISKTFTLITIVAPKKKRFERRSDLDPDNEEEFFERDKIDLENKGLQKVIDLSDMTLDNSGTFKELFELIEKKLFTE